MTALAWVRELAGERCIKLGIERRRVLGRLARGYQEHGDDYGATRRNAPCGRIETTGYPRRMS
jgi:hypothetical protein